MQWTAERNGYLYTLDSPWLPITAAAAVVLALAALFLLRCPPVYDHTRNRRPGAVGLVLALLALASVSVSAAVAHLPDALGFVVRSPMKLFGAPLGAQIGGSLAASLMVALVSLVLVKRAPRFRRPQYLAGVALVAAMLTAQGSAAHSVWVVQLGSLPVFEAQTASWVHQGASLDVESHLDGRRELWEVVQPGELTAPSGPLVIVEDAHARGITVHRESSIETREELGDPRFPLRVGNRWVYDVARGGNGQFFWFFPTSRSETIEERALVVEVLGQRVVDGVREFEVQVDYGRGRSRKSHWFYAAEGQTFVRRDGESVPLAFSDQASEDFAFPPLGGRCRGTAPPSGEVELPGPCMCLRNTMDFSSVFVTVLTIGLIVPESQRRTLRLRGSRRGPDDAAAAPVVDVPIASGTVPCPPATAPLCVVARAHRGHYERFLDRLRSRGLSVTVVDPARVSSIVVRGTPAQLEAELGVQATWAPTPATCPGQTVCRPTLETRLPSRARRATIFRVSHDAALCGST
ncbi:MAG: hypothetical protein JRH11_03805 [Deltaproteobacteria bacterium]|nr:hypothetical protein [Deltaproteobacteria bacterium]